MNAEEYTKLDRIDRDHWFYKGKRAIVRRWIARYLTLGPGDVLIDAGMGTGVWAVEMARTCRVIGIDSSEESLKLAAPRLVSAGGIAMLATLDRVGLPDSSASVVTMLDVMEHLKDDRAAFAEVVRLTRPGGLIVITVPAMQWLWSDWDVALHHYRRYSRGQLLSVLAHPAAEVVRCAYFNSVLLPAIAMVRFWRRLRRPPANGVRAEDLIPREPFNQALYRVLTTPACWKWFQPPVGVSLLAIVRKN